MASSVTPNQHAEIKRAYFRNPWMPFDARRAHANALGINLEGQYNVHFWAFRTRRPGSSASADPVTQQLCALYWHVKGLPGPQQEAAISGYTSLIEAGFPAANAVHVAAQSLGLALPGAPAAAPAVPAASPAAASAAAPAAGPAAASAASPAAVPFAVAAPAPAPVHPVAPASAAGGAAVASQGATSGPGSEREEETL
ncbi:hypothetical protein HYFRA_00009499 [Hymenoscyphus fraxineus]|uniref:Uncharacterized protein n=1 Tax=Hymenoscyphus fraxineus TaxID=746836 RepID=A0A9N9L0M0_9HELO|nr:hypothetical protein HYFRA_00009499 [Hymenoscyphus fraxineus]